jgi:plasmid stabilization system protein ParE
MSRLEISERASVDLTQILWYIARRERNVTIGQKWTERLLSECERIAKSPGIGRSQEQLQRELRRVAFRGYLIFYKYDSDSDCTTVVRVLHGARNVRAQFRDAP